MDWPATLSINAWTGPEGQPSADIGTEAVGWAVTGHSPELPQLLYAGEPVDKRNWRHEKVGWGLVLPENEQISEADRAVAADAPSAIRKLLAARPGAPVFRYRPEFNNRFLQCYYADGSRQPPTPTSGATRGIGKGRLPQYLLIYGSPQQIPWSFQYVLNSSAFVGRLDLEEPGLTRYVDALIRDWDGAGCRPDQPVVWAVDHGDQDITWLMRRAIATPVFNKLAADTQIGNKATNLAGPGATATALIDTLKSKAPALIVTTSHGMTGPLNDPALMARQLGLLVDHGSGLLRPEALLKQWQPDGAIWYSHACCSAGCDGETRFKGLVTEGSSVERTLEAVAGLGAQVAPLPKQLLGAEKPLRAFIGHVEPTFDWTIGEPETGQVLTDTILDALYGRMYRKQPEPVGMAFEGCYRHVGELLSQWNQALRNINKMVKNARVAALRSQLTALDRQSMVILGDPTACLPPLPS
jgi:hypothetical protein